MRAALSILLLCVLCGHAARHDPAIINGTPINAALMAAAQRGYVGIVSGNSMEPTLRDGEIVVIVRESFDAGLSGKVASYRPAWNGGRATVHRVIGGNPHDGFIMAGDNAIFGEPCERLTADKYNGVVVAVFRQTK